MFFYDFYYLYAAAQLIIQGTNPYLHQPLENRMHVLGWPADETAFELFYPPWGLVLYTPLGFLTLSQAMFAWLLILCVVIFIASKWSLNFIQSETALSLSATRIIFSVLTFFPLIKLVLFGQSSFIVLFGVLAYWHSLKNNRHWLGGLALSLCSIKAHALLPLLAALVIFHLRKKDFSLICFLAFGFLAQCLIVVLIQPMLFVWYAESLPSMVFNSRMLPFSTLGQFLNLTFSVAWIPSVILIAGILWGVYRGLTLGKLSLRSHNELLLISLVATPYAFSHEFTLLLLPYLTLCAVLWNRSTTLTVGTLSALLCTGGWLIQPGLEIYLFWFPLALYAALRMVSKETRYV